MERTDLGPAQDRPLFTQVGYLVRLAWNQRRFNHLIGMNPSDEGLSGSVLIYVTVLFGVLALFFLPVYYANGPTVLQNSDAESVHETLAVRASGSFPLAVLKHDDIVDSATLAALNAKPKHVAATHRSASRMHTESSVAGLTPERSSRGFFPFSLF
jgi:hypothetical protein